MGMQSILGFTKAVGSVPGKKKKSVIGGNPLQPATATTDQPLTTSQASNKPPVPFNPTAAARAGAGLFRRFFG